VTDVLSEPTRAWLHAQHHAVLITLRSSGSAQSSNVVFGYDGALARVSVTADRAKTRNLARDPRAVLHVLGEDFSSYASVSVEATLGAVAREPGDAACRVLLALYEQVAGTPHHDPVDFDRAMVAEQRLVLSLVPHAVVGWGYPGA